MEFSKLNAPKEICFIFIGNIWMTYIVRPINSEHDIVSTSNKLWHSFGWPQDFILNVRNTSSYYHNGQ